MAVTQLRVKWLKASGCAIFIMAMENELSPLAITDGLATRFMGQNVLYYPSLPSTMEVAKKEAQGGAAQGTVVIAGEQTAARGRLGRAWLSPKGGLSISVIIYPEVTYLPYLIMIASLAVVGSIEAVTGLKAQLKWPNDVLIHGGKVSGILIESGMRGYAVDYSIIGIGINVNIRIADFPGISAIATSLSDELGVRVSRRELVRRLLVELEELYLALPEGKAIFKEWRHRLVMLGKKVSVKSGETAYQGLAEDVAGDGSLLLRHQDGRLIRVLAGDVSLRDLDDSG